MPYRVQKAFVSPPAPAENRSGWTKTRSRKQSKFLHHHHNHSLHSHQNKQHAHEHARDMGKSATQSSPIPSVNATPAIWGRLMKSLFLFRRLASGGAFSSAGGGGVGSAGAGAGGVPLTLALCVTSVENVPSILPRDCGVTNDAVYVSLEGPAVADGAHRTPRASIDGETKCAHFSNRTPAVVARVSPNLTSRLALRCGTTGALLGDAKIDARALADRATPCRLRVPVHVTRAAATGHNAHTHGFVGGLHYHAYGGHGNNKTVITCLALAVRGRDPEEETSWDARQHQNKHSHKNNNNSNKNKKWDIERRQYSDAALYPIVHSNARKNNNVPVWLDEEPERDNHAASATVVDVRRRLRSAVVADRQQHDYDDEVDDDEDHFNSYNEAEEEDKEDEEDIEVYAMDELLIDDDFEGKGNDYNYRNRELQHEQQQHESGTNDEKEEEDKWSDIDAVTDIDEVSLSDLSSIFLTVDTARPVAQDSMVESGSLGWFTRASANGKNKIKNNPRATKNWNNDDWDVEDGVTTRGPLEYL